MAAPKKSKPSTTPSKPAAAPSKPGSSKPAAPSKPAPPPAKPAPSKPAAAPSKPGPAPSKPAALGEAAPTAAELNAWKAASQKVDFRVEVLTTAGVQTLDAATAVPAGRWFAVVPLTTSTRRYQFVLQWQGDSKQFVLCHLVDGVGAARLPPANGWIRALDTGRLHVIASELPLSRAQLAAIIGGHEPGMGVAKPPNT